MNTHTPNRYTAIVKKVREGGDNENKKGLNWRGKNQSSLPESRTLTMIRDSLCPKFSINLDTKYISYVSWNLEKGYSKKSNYMMFNTRGMMFCINPCVWEWTRKHRTQSKIPLKNFWKPVPPGAIGSMVTFLTRFYEECMICDIQNHRILATGILDDNPTEVESVKWIRVGKFLCASPM